jgi:hypothetical protein
MSALRPSLRVLLVLAALCLPLVAVGAPAAPAAAQSQGSYVSVTNVTHTPQTPTAGESFEVETVIRNHGGDGGPFVVNEVYVSGQGTDRYIADDLGSLPPGSSMPVTLPVTLDDPGRHTFTVNVFGVTPSGTPLRIQHPVTVRVVDDTRPQIELSTREAVPGATRPVNVTVGNGRATALDQVAVTVSSPAVEFGVRKRVEARIDARNATTFQFPATVSEAGTHPVDVRLTYTDDGERRQLNRSFRTNFDAPANPGEVTLTGTEAVVQGGTLELSATASNVGTTDVEGVVVAVGDTSRVGSADYFVGHVEGSDFSSFTLTTSVTGNVSSVPIRVRYLVGGVERSYTTEIPVRQAPSRAPVRPDSGPPVVPVAAGAGVVVVAGAVYLWRR